MISLSFLDNSFPLLVSDMMFLFGWLGISIFFLYGDEDGETKMYLSSVGLISRQLIHI